MVATLYAKVALAAVIALTALLVGHHPPAHAAPTTPAPVVEGFPVPQGEDQAQNLEESIAKGCTAENLFEDLSCKGSEYKGFELIDESCREGQEGSK
jgi:hypothetical protein